MALQVAVNATSLKRRRAPGSEAALNATGADCIADRLVHDDGESYAPANLPPSLLVRVPSNLPAHEFIIPKQVCPPQPLLVECPSGPAPPMPPPPYSVLYLIRWCRALSQRWFVRQAAGQEAGGSRGCH